MSAIRANALLAAGAVGVAMLAATWTATAAQATSSPGASAAAAASGTRASNVKITGKVPVSLNGGHVVLLTREGRAYTSAIASNGSFAVSAPAAKASGATLQLIRKNNQYLGPVVLRVERLASGKYAAHLQLSGKSASLGNVAVSSGFGKTPAVGKPKITKKNKKSKAIKLALARYNTWLAISNTAKVRAVNGGGAPFGAGKAGLVTGPGSPRAWRAGDTLKEPGQDKDLDGIPNALDVDDNGNKSLDLADPASASGPNATAKLNPWTTLNLSPSDALNVHKGDVSPADIAAAVGGENKFALMFYIDQPYLFTGSDAALGTQADSVSNVWVDCGDLPYCGGSNPSAVATGISETPGFGEQVWSGYHGDAWQNNARNNLDPGSPRNGLFSLSRGLGAPTWVASIQPRTGNDTATEFRPGDVYTLHYGVRSDSSQRTLATMLNPYFVTVPVFGNDVLSGNTLNLTGNDVTVNILRPQRQAVADEAGSWRDIGNLHYGLVMNKPGGPEFGCAPSHWSGVSGATAPEDPQDNMFLWPLKDAVSQDMTVGSSEATAGIDATVDVTGCIVDYNNSMRSTGHTITASDTVNVSLVAAGEQLTGGANRATLSNMTLLAPPGVGE